MKKARNLLLILALTSLSLTLFAQDPPPPPPATHGGTGNQNPKGAPIDGGLGILLALGAAYGGYKIYKFQKEKTGEEVVD